MASDSGAPSPGPSNGPSGTPSNGSPDTPNIASALHHRAALHPERPAIIEAVGGRGWRGRNRRRVRRTTFGELSEQVRRTATLLARQGIGPGHRILVLVPMSTDLYAVLLGCLHRGATVVFVDAWAGRDRLEAAVAAAAPRAFIGIRKALWLRFLSPSLRRIPVRMRVAPGRGLVAARGGTASSGPGAEVSDEAHEVDPDHPALITFTTGSTGRPKGAIRSHRFLWAQHRALAGHMKPRAGDIDMPTLPIFVLNNLAGGVPSVLPDFDPRSPAEIDPARIHRQLTDEGVTTSTGSPAFYERLGSWCRTTKTPLPLRSLHTGGAPVLPPLARLLSDVLTGDGHVIYGSTEAEPISGISFGEMLGAEGTGLCVGAPVPQTSVRLLVPHDGLVDLGDGGWARWEAGPGEAGELVVAGEHVLEGYAGNPEAEAMTKLRDPDGPRIWHRTGDAARIDPRGRLWLLGRVGARVVRAGQVWWPLPAELRALSVPEVRHAAWFGEEDEALGMRAVLCVEVAGGRLGRDGREALAEALGDIPIDTLHVVKHITRDPRHASKTDLGKLREMLQP
ncbi:MAG: hypothetical protein EA352_05045 [Gemmatimonadales bacterium]|nr:MAG: hypothetical protein EA352_05045 [Gemmatimonadales bacterium]